MSEVNVLPSAHPSVQKDLNEEEQYRLLVQACILEVTNELIGENKDKILAQAEVRLKEKLGK